MTAVRAGVLALTVAAAGVAVAGCSSDTAEANDGDCTVRVLYADHVFRAVRTDHTPKPGRSLTGAEFAGCDDEPLADYGTPTLFELPHADTDQAVLVRDHGQLVVYVDKALDPSDWPSVVKTAAGGDLD